MATPINFSSPTAPNAMQPTIRPERTSGALVLNINAPLSNYAGDGAAPTSTNALGADNFQRNATPAAASATFTPNPLATPQQQLQDAYNFALNARNNAEQARNGYLNLAGQLNGQAFQGQQTAPQAPASVAPNPIAPNAAAPNSDPAQQQFQQQLQQLQQQQQLQQMQQQLQQQAMQQPGMPGQPPMGPNPFDPAMMQQQAMQQPGMPGQPPMGPNPFDPAMMQQQAMQQPGMPGQQPPMGPNPFDPAMMQQQAMQQPGMPGMMPPGMDPAQMMAMGQQPGMPGQFPMQSASTADLNNILMSPQNANDKLEAIKEIAMRGQGDPQTYELLKNEVINPPPVAGISSPDDVNLIRATALRALGNIHAKQNADRPLEAMNGISVIAGAALNKNENPAVRAAALEALGYLGRPQDPYLSRLFKNAEKDKNPDVKNAAMQAQAFSNAVPATGQQPGMMPPGMDPAQMMAMGQQQPGMPMMPPGMMPPGMK